MYEGLPNSQLFRGISTEEIRGILKCLSAVHKQYRRGEYIFRLGDMVSTVGLVQQGAVQIVQEDYWGNRRIIGSAEKGQIFGESYACVPAEPLMVSVVAKEDTRILLLDVKRILHTCSSSCEFHNRLIQNLLSIIAGKNLMLTRKIEHVSRKTIREKVLAYLSFQAKRQGSSSFCIPFDRQQLADYLAVDRSALSAELSKMQKEYVIEYKKNQFTILDD